MSCRVLCCNCCLLQTIIFVNFSARLIFFAFLCHTLPPECAGNEIVLLLAERKLKNHIHIRSPTDRNHKLKKTRLCKHTKANSQTKFKKMNLINNLIAIFIKCFLFSFLLLLFSVSLLFCYLAIFICTKTKAAVGFSSRFRCSALLWVYIWVSVLELNYVVCLSTESLVVDSQKNAVYFVVSYSREICVVVLVWLFYIRLYAWRLG